MGRVIVIGDCHGCIDELKELSYSLELKSDDRVISVGDETDRGPDPNAVVDFFRCNGFESVLSNHTEKYLRWASHEDKAKLDLKYKNPVKEKEGHSYRSISLENRQWLSKRPLFIIFKVADKSYIITHAGFEVNERPIEQQLPKIVCRVRCLDSKTGNYISVKPRQEPPENCVPWYEMWDKNEGFVHSLNGSATVIYGHQVVKEPLITKYTVGIDTGCVFGGHLTAFIINEDGITEFKSVQAKERYFQGYSDLGYLFE